MNTPKSHVPGVLDSRALINFERAQGNFWAIRAEMQSFLDD